MKGFTKLVLASAIIAASSSAFAMQAMDDETMSATTGQDGLSITINSSTMNDLGIKWIDRNGITNADYAGSTYTSAGAVVISNIGVVITDLSINVDAGSSAANNGQLNIGIRTTDDVIVNLNDGTNGAIIAVTSAGATGSATGTETAILSFSSTSALTVVGGFNSNIKLGNRVASDDFMTFTANIPTITLTGLTILDAVSTAANGTNNVGIGIGTISIAGLNVVNAVNVVDAGLQIDTTNTVIGSVGLERIKLGDQVTTASIGDVYITGLTANSIITIAGKN